MATFNSQQYAWKDIEIWMLGKKVAGAREIKYKVSQEKEVVYGAGNQPQGVQRGNKTYEGTLTLLQSEVEALTLKAVELGSDDITDITGMDIIVMYAPKGGVKTIDVIKFAEFTETEKGMAQNDKFAEISLPFIALGIEKGV